MGKRRCNFYDEVKDGNRETFLFVELVNENTFVSTPYSIENNQVIFILYIHNKCMLLIAQYLDAWAKHEINFFLKACFLS